MNYKIIFFLVIILNISCLKEFDIKTKNYYFLRGVIVNNYTPVFKLYECNVEGEKEVPYNNYKLEISTNDGQNEKMFNGKFSFLKGKSGVEYSVFCQVNGKIYSFKKQQPILDTLNINPNNVIKNNDLYINLNNSKLDYTFFLSEFETYNANKFNSLYYYGGINSVIFDDEKIHPILTNSYNKLQLWPPKEFSNLEEVTYLDYRKRCYKPFTWIYNGYYSNLYLFQMHKTDYDIITQLQKNAANKDEALFVGEANNFDYKENDFVGHVFTYNHYEKIKLNNFLDYDDLVTYQIHKNGVPIDTIKNSNIRISIKFQEFGFGAFSSFQKYQNNGILFFKDYIAYFYNNIRYSDQLKNGKVGDISCGNYQPSYKYFITVNYRDNTLKKNFSYTFPQVQEYKYQSENIVLNLP